ncbi:MAG: hypothetical protein Q9169_006311, partial [Polycauliona sp. 2 TL-2023]
MATATKRPCNNLRDGQCKFGAKCRFSHDPTTPCYHFRTRTGCSKGKACFFSHEQHSSQNPRASAPAAESDNETRFRKWTYMIPKDHRTYHQEIDTAAFFKTGWDLLLQSDAGSQQRLIKKLSSEQGLVMVKSLAEAMDFGKQENQEALSLFQNSLLPFFQIMSHREIASSLVLEHSVEQICNFLYGSRGHRGVKVFRFFANVLSIMVTDDDMDESEKRGPVLRPCIAVLERLIELNQGALLHQDFLPIVETISSCADPQKLYPDSRRSLDKTRLRLGLGSLIPSAATSKQADGQTATFKFHHDLPGALSSEGPRHDNDHQDIKDIQILPTVQEINSPRLEYLPFNNAANNHLSGLPALLDRQFRILREDSIGGLRDAVRREGERLEMGTFQASSTKQRNQERTHVHEDLKVRRCEIDRRKGLQLVADFAQPSAVSKTSERQRKEWWDNSRRLQPTSLVCLVSSTGHYIFCLVCDPTPTKPSKQRSRDDDESKEAQIEAAEMDYHRKKDELPSLHKDDHRAAVMLTLVDATSTHIQWISQLFLRSNPMVKMSLVEFPGVLLPSFLPTLQALQSMSQRLDLPFAEYLVLEETEKETRAIPAPLYLQEDNLALDLGPLTNGAPLALSIEQLFDRETLNEHTTLDEAQQVAVLHALNSSMALIQGPPGTGKSYTWVSIIKVLLHNRKAADLGPIICVCYTNHALDQLLEHLVRDGIKQIVRIGSRSKSEVLQDVNLHDLAQQIPQTKDEGYAKFLLNQELNSSIAEIETLRKDFNAPDSNDSLRSYLEETWPRHFQELFQPNVLEDGFETITRRKKDTIGHWLRSANPEDRRDRPLVFLHGMFLNGMSVSERRRLYNDWTQQRTKQLGEQMERALDAYQHTQAALDRYYKEQQRRALCEAHIVGVTTSGMAKNLDVLEHLSSKVMVCEEAGEVLEAHTLTALLPSVEHAILIGDHEQLRPQVKNYDLCHDNPRGKHLALDISLFERLVSSGSDKGPPRMPFSRLKIQRRMHPSIADLIRRTIYVDLEDDTTVSDYPGVDGMTDRLFWLTHDHREDGADGKQAQSDSKSNDFEVGMVSALASHLMRQGTYAAGDIAVLTPYVRQLQKLRRCLGEMFEIVTNERDSEALEEHETAEDHTINMASPQVNKAQLLSALRVATIDNFQGEEAKVVILSFVRSNAEGKCGFFRTSNRINVALSRARHGMYIIGDSQTACSICGDEDVKSTVIDYIEYLKYSEVDLNADPCIFPPCGHHITLDNLDQHMDMKNYYDYSVNESGVEVIVAAKDTSQPMSVPVQKNCPACRAPIRNIHRYGRIARRAWIDEATKKFIVWANANFVPLAGRTKEIEEGFQPQVGDAGEQDMLTRHLKARFLTIPRLPLEGSPDSQMRRIAGLTNKDKRFQVALRLRTAIKLFLLQVNEKEQPFSRIYDLVQDAKRHRGIEGTMSWTPAVLQTRNRLLATVLLLRWEYAIVANFLAACKGTAATISVDFQDFLKACQHLIEESRTKTQPANEVEGHLFWARFTALQRSMSDAVPDGSPLLLTARKHLQTARDLCKEYQGQTAGMLSEVEDVEKALRDSTFYTSVTNDEKAAVYAAMASDFRGTGHWYYCENGHPFTVAHAQVFKTANPVHEKTKYGMVLSSSCGCPMDKVDSVPRIDSAIELVNLAHANKDGFRGQSTPNATSALPSGPAQVASQHRQTTQLQNIQRKLADYVSLSADAELRIQALVSQKENTSPHASRLVQEALDQAILATSNLINTALQTASDQITSLSMPEKTTRRSHHKASPPFIPHPQPRTTKAQHQHQHQTSFPAVQHFLRLQQRNPPSLPPSKSPPTPLAPAPNTLGALWHNHCLMPAPDSYKGHLRTLRNRLTHRMATRSPLDLPHAPNGGLIPHSRYCYEFYDPFDGFQFNVGDRWVRDELVECVRWMGNLVGDYLDVEGKKEKEKEKMEEEKGGGSM